MQKKVFLILISLVILLGFSLIYKYKEEIQYFFEESTNPPVGAYMDLERLEQHKKGECLITFQCEDIGIIECDWSCEKPLRPYSYLNMQTGEVIGHCSKFCVTQLGKNLKFLCSECYPNEWTCEM